MKKLGLGEAEVGFAEMLLSPQINDEEIPTFDQLMSVIDGIAYYFIPSSLESEFNPMCGMRDVIQNGRFLDEVEATIVLIEEKIKKLKGPSVLGAINLALKQNPDDEQLIAQKNKAERIYIKKSF